MILGKAFLIKGENGHARSHLGRVSSAARCERLLRWLTPINWHSLVEACNRISSCSVYFSFQDYFALDIRCDCSGAFNAHIQRSPFHSVGNPLSPTHTPKMKVGASTHTLTQCSLLRGGVTVPSSPLLSEQWTKCFCFLTRLA